MGDNAGPVNPRKPPPRLASSGRRYFSDCGANDGSSGCNSSGTGGAGATYAGGTGGAGVITGAGGYVINGGTITGGDGGRVGYGGEHSNGGGEGGAGPLLALGVASAPPGKMALGYGAAPSEAAPPLAPLPTGRVFTSWVQGLGAWGELDGNGNSARLERSLGGVITGLDATLDNRWRVGLAGGYSRSEFDIDDRASAATNDNYHLALYGGGQLGPWAVRGGGAVTWHDIETRRNVAFPGLAERLEAETDARTGQVFGEIGYGMGLGQAALEPFAGLAYVNYDGDRFTESGAAALSGGDQAFETTFSTLGVRAASIVPLTATTAVTLHGMLGWRHAFGDVTPAAKLAFSSGGEAFTIAGVPLAEDSLVTEAGLDLDLTHSVKLGVSYEGQFADAARDHAVTGRLSWRF